MAAYNKYSVKYPTSGTNIFSNIEKIPPKICAGYIFPWYWEIVKRLFVIRSIENETKINPKIQLNLYISTFLKISKKLTYLIFIVKY